MFISADKESIPKIESLKTIIPAERPLRGPEVIGYLGEILGKGDETVRSYFPEIAALTKSRDREAVIVKFPKKAKEFQQLHKELNRAGFEHNVLTAAEEKAILNKENLRLDKLGKKVTTIQRKKIIALALAAAARKKRAEIEERKRREVEFMKESYFDIWIKHENETKPKKQYRVYVLKNGFEILKRNKR